MPRTKSGQRRQPPSAQRSPTPPAPAAEPGPGWAEAIVQQVLRPAVTATCWVDPGEGAQPYPASVTFSGRRAGVSGRPRQSDRFERVERIGPLVPGSGPVSVTTRVTGLTPGEWLVWARPTASSGGRRVTVPQTSPPPFRALSLRRFLWPKGNPVSAGNTGTRVTTRAEGLTTGPGLIPVSWVPLVALGVVVALAVQAGLAGRAHLSIGAVLGVSAAASVAGAAGARAWYVALKRGKVSGLPTQGLCIQGFIAAAVIVLLAAVPLAGLPLRTFLDISAPGLFFGMAIGRQGCFLHGCCVGRPTASRRGIWASDGRIGARRAPTQQLESLACLVIGLAALLIVLRARPPAGTVFLGALAAYTVVRQLLFPYRAEPRRTSRGRQAALITAELVLIADIIIAIAA